MKTILIDSEDISAMVQKLRGAGYVVFKDPKDLSYPEVGIIIEILIREGYKIVSTK